MVSATILSPARQKSIFLWGPMGVGKSTLGAALAARRGWTFVDTDRALEARLGQSVAVYFAREGEARFRSAERAFLETLLDEEAAGIAPRVVALGGGSLLDRSLRLRALEAVTVVTLDAPLDELLARTNVSRETRPLLGGEDPEKALRRLLDDRAAAYRETHGVVRTLPDDVVGALEHIELLADEAPCAVAAGLRTYAVTVSADVAPMARAWSALKATSFPVVTDENVAQLAAFGRAPLPHAADPCVTVLRAGETHKTLGALQLVWDAWLTQRVDRNALVAAVGGGVVTDMAGFAAATWHRGVRWWAVPTTLLGMVDASVGGKTGVDLGVAKNALGAFHPPVGVHADTTFLATEPERSYRSGIAEIVKTALLARPRLLDELLRDPAALAGRDPSMLRHAVASCASAKAAIVSRDPEERGERAVLNLGHTLGHALESAGGFDRYTHGEAVALGTLAALRVGTALGHTHQGPVLEREITRLFDAVGLPTQLGRDELERALPLLGLDKKKDGASVRYIVVDEPGRPRIVSLPLSELTTLLRATLPAGR
jgi:shikimate kinase/3-dehydroquinate synthase